MLDRALALARQGFLVFPIFPGKKTPPLVAAWQNVATSDEETIRAWWTRWPEANIGVHCEDLLVLDIDPKKGGYDSLDALEKEIQLDATLEVGTPSGGRHIYYRCPGGVRNGVDVLGPGVDVRSTHGYVVGPGSKTEVGEYAVLVDEPLGDVPPELLDRVRARGSAAVEDSREPVVETDVGAAIARARDFLDRHPVAVEGQGGDHHTFATVARMRDFGVPEDRAAEALEEWNGRCVPPWAAEDLAVKIRNAYRYAENPAGVLTPEGLGFQTVPGSDTSGDHVAGDDVSDRTQNGNDRTQNEYVSELLHPADVELDSVLATNYLIKGVLERQSNAVAFGHWNVGKAQPLDEVVLTPTGWRRMGDLAVGDAVIGSSGRAVKITAVYPQGRREVWEVEFHNGTVVRCCGDHLWTFRDYLGAPTTKTTAEFASMGVTTLPGRHATLRWRVPLVAPVRYAAPPVSPVLDPYLVGVLLGDGGLTHYVGLSAGEKEIPRAVAAMLPAGHRLRHKGGCDYQVIVERRGARNAVWGELKRLGMAGKKSTDKAIPQEYLLGSVETRLAVLQGLLDTDGYVNAAGSVDFAVSSPRLIGQVKEMAESLGAVVGKIHRKETTHAPSYRIGIRMPDGMPPFRLGRKAKRYEDRASARRRLTLRVRDIRRTGETAEMQCISVDAADQLYVTRGFVLTHNTFVVLDMAASIAVGVRWFGKRVRKARVLYLGYEGLRAMKKRIIALRKKYPQLADRGTPFEWHPMRLPLTRADGVAALGAILRAYSARHGGAPELIIIDPLQNALGGDDSDAQLMGALNECVLALVQRQRCTVLRVHHSGHANAERARGHSSLPAGVDTEIRITEQEIALTKQRDDVRGKFFFKLNVETLGVDADGDEVTTCTVAQVEDNPLSPELSGPQQTVLDALVALRKDGGRVSKTDVRDCTPGMDAAERRELIRVLERKQYLRPEGTGWIVCERGPAAIFD